MLFTEKHSRFLHLLGAGPDIGTAGTADSFVFAVEAACSRGMRFAAARAVSAPLNAKQTEGREALCVQVNLVTVYAVLYAVICVHVLNTTSTTVYTRSTCVPSMIYVV